MLPVGAAVPAPPTSCRRKSTPAIRAPNAVLDPLDGRGDPVGVAHQFDAGRAHAEVASSVAGVADPPGPGELKTMVDEAAIRGQDLVAEMVRRLKRDIMAARNRLDAMLWRP